MSNKIGEFVICFIAGHDKISKDRVYRHRGSDLHKGEMFYEGIPNRRIIEYASKIATTLQIPHVVISNPNTGPNLTTRAKLVNYYTSVYKHSLTIDSHCNAGKGEGIEAYTTIGETLSDKACSIFYEVVEDLTNYKIRKEYRNDKDPDKERNFYIITTVYGPAFLPEFLFYDLLKQAKELTKEEVLRLFAHILMITAIRFYSYLKSL